MPPAPPYAAQHNQQLFPALYLYPLNDSFVPKHIALAPGQRVKIGRQTNPKTAPGEKNGFFDSKVLSRQHAEVWEEGGKIYIKDVKSSNGTFINGDRLSPEGVESDPYELKSDDIVEFGIDIVGEDNKTIIHHKVAARAICILSEKDAQDAARAEHLLLQQQQAGSHPNQQHPHQQHQQQYGPHPLLATGPGQAGPNGLPAQFSFANATGNAPGQQRRPGAPLGQGLAGMGGMGGNMRPPGKSGLSFEHVLFRLQGELQKSRETGSELHSLNGSILEIHDVLGGKIPNLPRYPSSLPPVRPQSNQPQDSAHVESISQLEQQPDSLRSQQEPSLEDPSAAPSEVPPRSQSVPPSSSPVSSASLSDLQNRLHDAQSSLALHADKVRMLEEVLSEQEHIKREVRALREMMESRRSEILIEQGLELNHRHQAEGNRSEEQMLPRKERLLEPHDSFDHEDEEEVQRLRLLDEVDEEADDNDDARSISTIVPHELGRVPEEDEEQMSSFNTTSNAEKATEGERVVQDDEQKKLSIVIDEDRGCGGDGDRADPIDPEREREERERGREKGQETEIEDRETAEQEALRKQEDLNVSRPRTPEPTSLGLSVNLGINLRDQDISVTQPPRSPRSRSGTLLAPSSRSPTSPLALASTSPPVPPPPIPPPSPPSPFLSATRAQNYAQRQMMNDEILDQMVQLSAQVSAVAKLTSSLEAQHAAAQETIKALEGKVESLERVLREREETEKKEEEAITTAIEPTISKIDGGEKEPELKKGYQTAEDEEITNGENLSLTAFLSEWKNTVEGQWSSVREEWKEERERLAKAREDWEARLRSSATDNNVLEQRMSALQNTTNALARDLNVQKVELGRLTERVGQQAREQREHKETLDRLGFFRMGNGDVVKFGIGFGSSGSGSGLVTPPSPRSQSSDSDSGRRRKKNGSLTRGRRSRSGSTGKTYVLTKERDREEEDSDDAGSVEENKKVTAFGNGIPSSPLRSHRFSRSIEGTTSATTSTSAHPPMANLVHRRPTNGMPISRAYYFSNALDVKKELGVDYEDDDTGSSMAEEEIGDGDGDEGHSKEYKGNRGFAEALATPASMSASLVSVEEQGSGLQSTLKDEFHAQGLSRPSTLSLQTAGAVVVLAVAAAAVFWKVRPEA